MSLLISLTSISQRLDILKYTLLSLREQNYKADRIILCLSKDSYLLDKGIKETPDWLFALEDSGAIEIKWVENTGSYRKLLPVYASSNPDDWIVTCDDDVIYGPEWLGTLVQAAKKYPEAIICGRARIPLKNYWGKRQSYLNWPIAPLGSEGLELLPTGVGGILYRKHLLDANIMQSNEFKKIAPKQDDLWFNLARNVAGSKVYVSSETAKHVFPIETSNALFHDNATTKRSAAFFERLLGKTKRYLGFPLCGNDVALQKIDNYMNSFKATNGIQ